ncbi:MAG TPA: tellurite resistance/C4-dicarboxylate transporter family protein [Actinomycetota bacterium]
MSARAATERTSPIATLFPGSFALVMATGIVAIAAYQQGFETLARGFLAVNVIAYVVLWMLTIVRLVRFPGRVRDDIATHQRGAGFLTIVAGTNVLGSGVTLLTSWDGLALGLWIAGLVLWFVITYWFLTAVTVRAEKPPLESGIGGAWLLLVVSTESIAALGALLAPSLGGSRGLLLVSILAHLVGLMLYVVVIGLIFYRWTFFPLSGEQVTPPYWINMGALAITTLAGSNIVVASGSWETSVGLVPFLTGTTLLAWGFATWWIPLLLAIGVWRHGVQRVPLRYDPQYWSLVFPLGMYAASTFRLEAALHVGLQSAIATTAFWIALAAWFVTAAGLIGSALLPRRARDDMSVESSR